MFLSHSFAPKPFCKRVRGYNVETQPKENGQKTVLQLHFSRIEPLWGVADRAAPADFAPFRVSPAKGTNCSYLNHQVPWSFSSLSLFCLSVLFSLWSTGRPPLLVFRKSGVNPRASCMVGLGHETATQPLAMSYSLRQPSPHTPSPEFWAVSSVPFSFFMPAYEDSTLASVSWGIF